MLTIAHQLFTINLSKTFLSPIAQKTNRRIFGRTDGQGDSYIPPKLCVRGGIETINLRSVAGLQFCALCTGYCTIL